MKTSTVICFTISLSFFCLCFQAVGQGLIRYLPEETMLQLSETQRHYHEVVMSWPYSVKSNIITIDLDLLKEDVIVFNLSNNVFTARKENRNEPTFGDGERVSWIGKFDGGEGDVHIVYSADAMVGFIQFDYLAFLIRPLGGNLHMLVEWDMTLDDGCKTPSEGQFEFQGEKGKKEHLRHPDLENRMRAAENNLLPANTGECNVRVLVVYTDATDNAVFDVLLDIINMVNMSNTGYINSSNGPDEFQMSIELAAAFRVGYNESGDINTDLDCITDPGCLNVVHVNRGLWKADQCVLLTSTGSGLGWVSTNYENQFTVTGVPNFYSFTFHHELAHNAGCTHAINQASQPGTSPYSGWGETVTGCFRTVLAYPDACGIPPCPRHNIFSDNDPDTWFCGGDWYTPGSPDSRNQDRLTLSFPVLLNHETVEDDEFLAADYNWAEREAVHVAASKTLSYASPVNNFIFANESLGSFRAGDQVSLGEGFWARAGTDFRAYIDNCGAASSLTAASAGQNTENFSRPDISFKDFSIAFSPNPFSGQGVIKFELPEETEVEILLLDPSGRLVRSIAQPHRRGPGKHAVLLDAELAPGLYFVKFSAGRIQTILKVSKL